MKRATRSPAARDRRGVALHLTAAGEGVRRAILAEREAAQAPLVSRLSEREQRTLGRLLGKLLTGVSRDDTHKLRICRLCDSAACTDCPIRVPVAPPGSGEAPA